MKRALAALMALVLLTLCACQTQDEAANPAPTAQPDAAEVVGEIPSVEEIESAMDGAFGDGDAPDIDFEGDVDAVPITSYAYTAAENTDMRVSYRHPSHWIDHSTDGTIIYLEPVAPDATPARMAITRRAAGKIVVTEDVGRDKLDEFARSLKASCTDFKMKRGKRFMFSGNTGFCFTYLGTFNQVPMRGYVAMTFQRKKNSFYLYHFSAPQDRYKSLDNVRKTLLKSIKV